MSSSVIFTLDCSKPPVCSSAKPASKGEPSVKIPDFSVAENLAFPSSFKPTGLEKIPNVHELMGVKFCSPYLAEIFPSSDILSSDITTSSREAGI